MRRTLDFGLPIIPLIPLNRFGPHPLGKTAKSAAPDACTACAAVARMASGRLVFRLVKREAVDAGRRAAEDRPLLVGRGARRQALQRVPQGGIADAHLLDREVALGHAAPGAE